MRPETRSDYLLRKGHEASAEAARTSCAETRHRLMLEAEAYWCQSVAALELMR
ncbi:MAG TPA: hypothetical protein VIJ85_04625 [Rhizomicrobium sp.]